MHDVESASHRTTPHHTALHTVPRRTPLGAACLLRRQAKRGLPWGLLPTPASLLSDAAYHVRHCTRGQRDRRAPHTGCPAAVLGQRRAPLVRVHYVQCSRYTTFVVNPWGTDFCSE